MAHNHHYHPIHPSDDNAPVPLDVRTRRRVFATIRVLQGSLITLGFLSLQLIFSIPATPGSLNRVPAYIAHSSPGVVAQLAAWLIGAGFALQLIARPLKQRWSDALKGWIT